VRVVDVCAASEGGRLAEVAGRAGSIPADLAQLPSAFDQDVVARRAEEEDLDLKGRLVEVAADQVAGDGVGEFVEAGGLHAAQEA